jgi:hypothetical protein
VRSALPRASWLVLVALLAASTAVARAQDAPKEPPAGGAPVAEGAEPAPAPDVRAKKKKVSFRDPEDGTFDYSEYRLGHRGFLPVPFLITEPAVGCGGGLSLLFFQESIAATQGEQIERGERWSPPNIGGVAAFMTSNGTWGGGAGYFGSARGDRYRYEAELVGGGGAGFCSLIARKLGMWAGIDLAQGSGSDQTDIYFQVGSAWR